MATFKELGLKPGIMESLSDLGFTNPSPIQEKTIPFLLKSKKDLTALAQTGTGKTAAYGLPILNQIKVKGNEPVAIILSPTRELCLQISEDLKKYAKHSKEIEITAVYGGERIDFQIKALRKGTNIVVGTPGRVNDLIRRKFLKLGSIEWLVLDEADEMLDMGFKEDLEIILSQTPKSRQTLLFSATMSKSVSSIAKRYMKNAQEISVGEKNIGADMVSHEYYIVSPQDRFEALRRILDYLPGVYGILFCRTKNGAQEVTEKLKQANYNAEALHGDVSQNMRTKIMDRFKKQQIRLLVATDVAARGIDVSNLSHVINYNLPDQNEVYTHRSGRTGRAGNRGISISIVSASEARTIKSLENMIGKTFELKKVPNGEDVYKKQIENFISEIENNDTKEIDNKLYFKETIEKLKKYKKEDIIKHFIIDKFSHLAETYKNAYDLNVKAGVTRERMREADSVCLKVNIGRKHRIDVKGIFALINLDKKLKGVEVGKINLMPEYSIFTVEKTRADEVIRILSGVNFRGVRIDIQKSNNMVSYSFKKRSGGGRASSGFKRGYKGKKSNFRRSRY